MPQTRSEPNGAEANLQSMQAEDSYKAFKLEKIMCSSLCPIQSLLNKILPRLE